jgi:nicotinic acid phosphoribosyltransferase
MTYTTRSPFDPMTLIDGYKADHIRQYPENTTGVYSNMTPRGSRLPGVDHVVFFGLQSFLKRVLEDMFEPWFAADENAVCAAYDRRMTGYLGPSMIGTDHIRALHRLGYLPLRFSALPEGTRSPMRVPTFLIENTHPDFFWLVNYVETIVSAETWQSTTSATIACEFRKLLDFWAHITSDIPEFVDWQGHDFSFRGLSSLETAAMSGAAHLLAFAGTDTIPALDWIEAYYSPQATTLLGGSVPATEHSVMCAGGQLSETDTFRRLLDLYPTGIVSVVSDTWDFWAVLTEILPSLKDEIMARDGKLVIRPDSGDPALILCGDPDAAAGTPAHKGCIELLWDLFGGEINSKGYRQLDSHIGAIYGDSITRERANEICSRLALKGFASTNVVLGIGSYTYQYNTRDTFGTAMKATWAVVDGEARELFKDPKTDNGLKRSARGRLAVIRNENDELELIERATPEQEAASVIQPVWENGKFVNDQPWEEIVSRVGLRRV